MKKEDYSKYELPKDISLSLRSKFDEFPSEILFTLESITEREFMEISHGLGSILPKFRKRKGTVYLIENGNYYRACLTCPDGSEEALHQACESLVVYAPSVYSSQTGKGTNGDKKNKERGHSLGRRNGRRPVYLLGK